MIANLNRQEADNKKSIRGTGKTKLNLIFRNYRTEKRINKVYLFLFKFVCHTPSTKMEKKC